MGASHALEVDHMVAVTAFVGRSPRAGHAALFGIRWGLGHALVVLIVGSLLAWLGVTLPRDVQGWAELGVGAMLLGLGVWALRAARRLHVHSAEDHGGHAHLHAHPSYRQPHVHTHDHRQTLDRSHQHRHEHRHGHGRVEPRHGHLSTLVGAAHGLAGTAPVVALIPVTLIPGFWPAFGYLAAFGAGTISAMGIYAGLAALAARRASPSVRSARVLGMGTGVASMAVGVWWMLEAARSLTG